MDILDLFFLLVSNIYIHYTGILRICPPPTFIILQEGDFQSEAIRFGTERMTIDSWVRKRTYDAFREFVGSGMNYHLQVSSDRWWSLS